MPQSNRSAPDTQGASGSATYRLEVCSRPALARTDVSLIGLLDTVAVAAVADALEFARAQGHTVSLDLHQVLGATPEVRRRLLGGGPDDRRSPARVPRFTRTASVDHLARLTFRR